MIFILFIWSLLFILFIYFLLLLKEYELIVSSSEFYYSEKRKTRSEARRRVKAIRSGDKSSVPFKFYWKVQTALRNYTITQLEVDPFKRIRIILITQYMYLPMAWICAGVAVFLILTCWGEHKRPPGILLNICCPLCWSKVAWVWNWPLISMECRGQDVISGIFTARFVHVHDA